MLILSVNFSALQKAGFPQMKKLEYISGENVHSRQQKGSMGIEELPYVNTTSHIRVRKYWRYIFLAVILLSKVFLITAVYYYVQYQHFRKLQESVTPQEQPRVEEAVSLKKS